MKRIFNILSVVAAFATLATACTASDTDNVGIDSKGITLTIEADASTRTEFDSTLNNGTGDVKWSGNEKMAVYFSGENKKTCNISVTDNTAILTYKASVDAAGTYYIEGMLPESAWVSGSPTVRTEDKSRVVCYGMELSNQTATKESFDPAADILVSAPIAVEITDEEIAAGSKSVESKFRFTRPFATSKFTFTNADNTYTTESVNSVTVKSSAYDLIGRARFNADLCTFVDNDGTTPAESVFYYGKSKEVVVTTSGMTVGNLVLWVVTAPFAGEEGTIEFVIDTPARTITKSVNLSADKRMNIRSNALNTATISLGDAVAVSKAPTIEADESVTLAADETTKNISVYVTNSASTAIAVQDAENSWLSATCLEVVSGEYLVNLSCGANEGEERTAVIVVTATNTDGDTVTKNISVKQSAAGTTTPTLVSDVLTASMFTATSSTYKDFDNITATSDAVYAGNSAKNSSAIRLRTENSNSGIVTTKSGGKVRKITVVWNSGTTSGRKLDIYGKSTAYTSATELFADDTKGESLGSIICGTSNELLIEENFEYIGLRSNSNWINLDSITITYEQ